MPHLKIERFGGDDTSWLASGHGIRNARTGTIDISAFAKATHYPDGFLPSGLPVNAADEGAIKPWTDKDGEQLGFLLFNVGTDGVEDVPAPVLRHGLVKTANLPGGAFTHAAGDASGFTFIGGTD
jgi:hypothetical protein